MLFRSELEGRDSRVRSSKTLCEQMVDAQPILLLDDVFSELDPYRSAALVERLPSGQVLLTTAVDPPPAVGAHRVVEVARNSLLGRFSGQ